jgi:serine/threonine protein kinase
VVYAATVPTCGIVAAKIPFNEESRKVLDREATVLRYLHSLRGAREFIIPYYGKYEFDDTFALCFELCPQTMGEYISSQSCGGPIPVVGIDVWKSWLSTLLSAVDFLHDSGVLHNDIKPQNILLTASLHPYLSDFAVSSPQYDLGLPSPPDMHILGTTVFTAPELLSAEDVPTSPESDIYSLGITMFVAAMGVEPFSWTRSVTQKIMLKKRGDIFAGTEESRISGRLIEIIRGMCTSGPARRWSSTRVRTALHQL